MITTIIKYNLKFPKCVQHQIKNISVTPLNYSLISNCNIISVTQISTMSPNVTSTAATVILNNVHIKLIQEYDYNTWTMILLTIFGVFFAILCGLWCLLAARNVKDDETVVIDDNSRSIAGSDFSVVEVENEEVKEVGGFVKYLTDIRKSVIFI